MSLSSKRKTSSSAAAEEVGVSDIESVAHRVVDATVSRLKEEFSNAVEADTKELNKMLSYCRDTVLQGAL